MLSEKQILMLLNFYNQGMSVRKIAKLVGCSRPTVRNYSDFYKMDDLNQGEEIPEIKFLGRMDPESKKKSFQKRKEKMTEYWDSLGRRTKKKGV